MSGAGLIQLILKPRWLASALLGLALSCSAFAADPIPNPYVDLTAVWIGPGEALTQTKIDELLSVLNEYPDSRKIVDAFLRKHQLKPTDLTQFLRPSTSLDPSVAAEYKIDYKYCSRSSSNEKGLTDDSECRALIEAFPHHKILKEGAYFTVLAYEDHIAFEPGRTLFDMCALFVHEFVHATLKDPMSLFETDMLSFKKADAFIGRELESAGGELPAYRATMRTLLQIYADHPELETTPTTLHELVPFFDQEGLASNEVGFRDVVIHKLGFKTRLTGEYERLGREQLERAQKRYEDLVDRVRPMVLANNQYGDYLATVDEDIAATKKRVAALRKRFAR